MDDDDDNDGSYCAAAAAEAVEDALLPRTPPPGTPPCRSVAINSWTAAEGNQEEAHAHLLLSAAAVAEGRSAVASRPKPPSLRCGPRPMAEAAELPEEAPGGGAVDGAHDGDARSPLGFLSAKPVPSLGFGRGNKVVPLVRSGVGSASQQKLSQLSLSAALSAVADEGMQPDGSSQHAPVFYDGRGAAEQGERIVRVSRSLSPSVVPEAPAPESWMKLASLRKAVAFDALADQPQEEAAKEALSGQLAGPPSRPRSAASGWDGGGDLRVSRSKRSRLLGGETEALR